MKKFKTMTAGLFRYKGLVYCKLAEPQEQFNAVLISDGTVHLFKDDDEVYEY